MFAKITKYSTMERLAIFHHLRTVILYGFHLDYVVVNSSFNVPTGQPPILEQSSNVRHFHFRRTKRNGGSNPPCSSVLFDDI